MTASIRDEDVRLARERYATAQETLEEQLDDAERALRQLTANSDDLRLMQKLRDDLITIEAEVTASGAVQPREPAARPLQFITLRHHHGGSPRLRRFRMTDQRADQSSPGFSEQPCCA